MTTTAPAPGPNRVLRAAAGLASAAAAVGIGHGLAALIDPATSPLLAVGSALIDAAPTPAKEFAVRTFGTADKPILLAGVAAALAVFAAMIGLLAWRHRRIALAGIAALGVAGVAAATSRAASPADALLDSLPSIGAGLAGVSALLTLTRIGAPGAEAAPAVSSPVAAAAGRSRRGFLLALAGTTALGALGGAAGAIGDQVRRGAAAARRLAGLPAPVSAAKPLPAGAQVPGMTPFVTPNDDFYRVDISLVTPRVDVETWSLTIDGMVERPLTLTYEELLAMPMIERDITMTCVSNEVGGRYVSSARWLGVPFSEIIARVGVTPGVDQAFSYSSDSGYTCSTPFQALSDGRDAMIAVGMNGQPLPDANGFPARMVVPGLFGFVSATKWLERIEFTTYDRRSAYWTERGWATDAPILTQSRIDVPRSLATLPKDKPVIAGVAWAQHRGIARVEIRIDGGEWQQTTLADDAGIDLWRQWSFVYDGPPGLHSAQVRATDATGATQPEERRKVFPSGATGWHQIQFTVDA